MMKGRSSYQELGVKHLDYRNRHFNGQMTTISFLYVLHKIASCVHPQDKISFKCFSVLACWFAKHSRHLHTCRFA